MRCYRVRKLLSEYLDETLSIHVEDQVRHHLDHCSRCADLASELRHTVALVQRLPRLETSAEFMPNLRRHLPIAVALQQRPTPREGLLARLAHRGERGRGYRFSMVLAPVALGFGLALYFLGMGSGAHMESTPPVTPVVSESDYLAALAREHAGYAVEHPVMDTSAANLKLTVASGPAPLGR